MNDETPTRSENPDTRDEAAPSVTPEEPAVTSETDTQSPVTPVIYTIGFIIVALLGVIIFQNMPEGMAKQEAAEDPEIAELKATLAALQSDAIGLGLSDGTRESTQAIADRLEKDARTLADLSSGYDSIIREKNMEIQELKASSLATMKGDQRLRDMLIRTQNERDAALDQASSVPQLRSDLEFAQEQLKMLRQQLDASKQEPTSLKQQLAESELERARLANELETLRAQLSRLEAKIREATLFAEDEDELLKEAVALFQALRKLQGATPAEMQAAYNKFDRTLGSTVMHTCKFPTGSAEVTDELSSELTLIPSAAEPNSMIFVVGYASETGEVDSNSELSENRATNVARVLDTIKQPDQKVQAVYLGQTKRFSAENPLENQKVEVWQIIPRPELPSP